MAEIRRVTTDTDSTEDRGLLFDELYEKNVKNCYEAITKFNSMPHNNWVRLFAIVTLRLPIKIGQLKVNKKLQIINKAR